MLYFFILKDHVDTRDLNTQVMAFDRLFLPLFSPEPPLDRYNLLSFNHIFDFLSEVLIWSPIALFILLSIILLARKSIDWNTLPVLTSGVTLLLFGGLFFVINPLLSMQLDWDMMAIPAPAFLVFVAVLAKQAERSFDARKLLLTCMAIAILSIPVFAVHAKPIPLSLRLEASARLL